MTPLPADSAAERLVSQLVQRCVQSAASDLHLEPTSTGYRARLRSMGQLKVIESIDAQLAPRVVAHIKVLAQLDITERRLPQDGRCRFQLPGQLVDCRVNTLPTLGGEKLVLRLLGVGNANRCLSEAGLLPSQRKTVDGILNHREGLILTTGPTGSGKTQTLYTLLQMLNRETTNISTVEDPVEVDLPAVNQVSVQPSLGLTFAQVLRALMRQDPDILMVGEIRDAETASMACQAAQTGHLVLATLHAASPLSALIRLQQLGVDGYQLAASLLLLMNQRLVSLTESKRIGVFELVPMTDRLRMALLANPNQTHYWQTLANACVADIDLKQAQQQHLAELVGV
ncbi:hypothetical protein CWE12_04680 [Aliidiomarina sedimenti]|uniref:Bacterial type II secretion system protein E domain-containing protein n=1 Tax=Aliidiomarina sedimenti TaxID=1933879 RepID=A0ABY0C021_9GAMM|nr:GspE/PulE family protein [Aliidiomarina sedimenti]RUO30554.1 hypothetical protein CWE12_04680 [Aliidiomarina sedimenti]